MFSSGSENTLFVPASYQAFVSIRVAILHKRRKLILQSNLFCLDFHPSSWGGMRHKKFSKEQQEEYETCLLQEIRSLANSVTAS
jgi:hypothetical protein